MAIASPSIPGLAPTSLPNAGFMPLNLGTSFMQQQLLVQMMGMMQLIFQQVIGSGGGGLAAPGASNFGGSSSGGIGNFLGGGSNNETSGTSNSAPTTDLSNVKGNEFGKKFAAAAEKAANRINTPGQCLRGVNDAMESIGIPVKREAAAYMALDDMQKNKRFQEVKVSKDKLNSLPPGAVVVWNKGPGLPYGHISVSLGNGKEASSVVRNQLKLNTAYHVFLPKG